MTDDVVARYLISPSDAQEKATLLQELAGGKSALLRSQALEAVAVGCGFGEWRELAANLARLEAGEANSLDISPWMLADDEHVDAEIRHARRANQVIAIRRCITCSSTRAEELASRWALSGQVQQSAMPLDDETPAASEQASESRQQCEESKNRSEIAATDTDVVSDKAPEFACAPATKTSVSYKKRRAVSSR